MSTLSDAAAPGHAAHLDAIRRISVSVQVFLGSASMPIGDLMKLGPRRDRQSSITTSAIPSTVVCETDRSSRAANSWPSRTIPPRSA